MGQIVLVSSVVAGPCDRRISCAFDDAGARQPLHRMLGEVTRGGMPLVRTTDRGPPDLKLSAPTDDQPADRPRGCRPSCPGPAWPGATSAGWWRRPPGFASRSHHRPLAHQAAPRGCRPSCPAPPTAPDCSCGRWHHQTIRPSSSALGCACSRRATAEELVLVLCLGQQQFLTKSRIGSMMVGVSSLVEPSDLLRQRGLQVTAQRLAVLRATSEHPHSTARYWPRRWSGSGRSPGRPCTTRSVSWSRRACCAASTRRVDRPLRAPGGQPPPAWCVASVTGSSTSIAPSAPAPYLEADDGRGFDIKRGRSHPTGAAAGDRAVEPTP